LFPNWEVWGARSRGEEVKGEVRGRSQRSWAAKSRAMARSSAASSESPAASASVMESASNMQGAMEHGGASDADVGPESNSLLTSAINKDHSALRPWAEYRSVTSWLGLLQKPASNCTELLEEPQLPLQLLRVQARVERHVHIEDGALASRRLD
jgi:hypothetical protein